MTRQNENRKGRSGEKKRRDVKIMSNPSPLDVPAGRSLGFRRMRMVPREGVLPCIVAAFTVALNYFGALLCFALLFGVRGKTTNYAWYGKCTGGTYTYAYVLLSRM